MNVSGFTFRNAETSEDRIAIVDYTEEDLEGHMHWSNFLTDCDDSNKQYNLFGYFDDITFHMEMNFDKGTITGSCSGSFNYDSYSWKRDLSFSGEFTGILDKYNWNYKSWLWEFDSNFSLSLTFRYEQRCTNEANEVYWNTRQETISVTARLEGNTFAGRGGIGAFYLTWEDPGSGPEELRRFRLSCKNRLDSGGCDLPADIPEAIDITANLQGPQIVRNTDPEVRFELEVSGRDLDRVKEVNWYFSYFDDEVWADFRWFETFERTDASPLVIDGEKLTEWKWYVNTYGKPINGEKSLLLQIRVELKAGEDEWLYELAGYNFTYIVGHSIDFNLIIDDIIEVYPTMKNESLFIFEHSPDTLDSDIFYEVSTTLPEYLSVEFERKKDTNSSDDGLLENKLIVSLDMTKAPSLSLPAEHKITCKARSVSRKESIETSKEVTLKLKPVEWLNLHYIASQQSGLGSSLQTADVLRIDKIVETFNTTKEPKIGYILLIDLDRDWSPTYYDGTLKRGGNLLRLYHGKLEKIESKVINMGSPDSLQHFIEKAQKLIPSKNHHLIISDHGLGINGVAMDGHPADLLEAPELRTGLENKHFELITFETCQTALIEILYELRKAADYIIASQYNMYEDGINIGKIFPTLLQKPKSSTIELAQSIIDTYAETISRPLTLSL
ncbi:hypothetical protein KA005_54990, partial [bacterium]|nr:hypothetical protein [bacterium]